MSKAHIQPHNTKLGMKKYLQSSKLLQFNEKILHSRILDRPNRLLEITELEGKEIPVNLYVQGRLKDRTYIHNEILIRKT
jgi:hypothetical protein